MGPLPTIGEPGRSDEADQEIALEVWADLVGRMGEASDLFILMAGDAQNARQSFKAAFYGKPATTLSKRASALGLYRRWADTENIKPWPVTEEVAFKYVRYLIGSRAPPTRAQSFREALGFAKGFVGLKGVDQVLTSRRVTGSVQEALDARVERIQRDPLTVEMVKLLEAAMMQRTGADLVVLGFILFCLHGRARVGDAIRADREPYLDVPDPAVSFGFVEAGFLRHKTSYAARSKLRLPVVADAFGLTSVPWAARWLEARRQLGFDASIDGFLLPAVYGDFGKFALGRTRSTTAEVSLVLKEILKFLRVDGDLTRIGAHSLKPTLLS